MSTEGVPAVRGVLAPLRVVSVPGASRYSCLGCVPEVVMEVGHVLHRSGLHVTIVGLAWPFDPRGDCGECPACRASELPYGRWAAMYAVD
jgi:hypothetical protein